MSHADETQTQDVERLRRDGGSTRGVRILWSPDPSVASEEIAIPLLAELSFGRAMREDVTAVIEDSKLSRKHVTISARGGAVEVIDEGSKNGTYVNGARVTRESVGEGAVIRIGDTLLEYGQVFVADPQPRDGGTPDGLVGGSQTFRNMLEQVDRIAARDVSVLLLGETGTGKEVVANRVHRLSGRSGRFVAVNCAAIPATLIESHLFGHVKGAFTGATMDASGCFRSAHQGTLFLDEIGDLPLELQAKLLRALDSGEVVPVGTTNARRVDVRVVAATNADVRRAVADGLFRSDLFARLSTFIVDLPPLRARRYDIPRLARHFLSQISPDRAFEFSVQFVEALMLHQWPMNVREVRSAMHRISVMDDTDVLFASHARRVLEGTVEPESRSGAAPAPTADLVNRAPRGGPTRDQLAAASDDAGGNITAGARKYGVDRRTVYRWMRNHDLDR